MFHSIGLRRFWGHYRKLGLEVLGLTFDADGLDDQVVEQALALMGAFDWSIEHMGSEPMCRCPTSIKEPNSPHFPIFIHTGGCLIIPYTMGDLQTAALKFYDIHTNRADHVHVVNWWSQGPTVPISQEPSFSKCTHGTVKGRVHLPYWRTMWGPRLFSYKEGWVGISFGNLLDFLFSFNSVVIFFHKGS